MRFDADELAAELGGTVVGPSRARRCRSTGSPSIPGCGARVSSSWRCGPSVTATSSSQRRRGPRRGGGTGGPSGRRCPVHRRARHRGGAEPAGSAGARTDCRTASSASRARWARRPRRTCSPGRSRRAFGPTASQRSFNNELGVPITLASAPDDTQVAVIEMGSRGIGHVAELCEIARPTVGIVTVVAAVHTETLGGIDGVATAKRELVEALPAGGLAVLNADDVRVAAMAGHTAAEVLRFGAAGEVRATDVTVDDELRPSFMLVTPWGDVARPARSARSPQRRQRPGGGRRGAVARRRPRRGRGRARHARRLGLAHAALADTRRRRGPERRLQRRSGVDGGRVAGVGRPARGASGRRARDDGRAGRRGGRGAPPRSPNWPTTWASRCWPSVPTGTASPVSDPAAAVDRLGAVGPGVAVLVKGSRVVGLEAVATALTADAGMDAEDRVGCRAGPTPELRVRPRSRPVPGRWPRPSRRCASAPRKRPRPAGPRTRGAAPPRLRTGEPPRCRASR